MQTVGISPKLVVAVVMAVLGYLLTQTVLDVSPLLEVAGQAVLVALGVYAASPGTVEEKR